MDVLKIIADNQALSDALKDLLLGELKNTKAEADTLSDEELGQRVRARLTAKAMIETAFMKIAKYRTGAAAKDRPMPAR